MATTTTETAEIAVQSQERQLDNIEEFVKNATWRELLLELVDSNQLDPWNIDIVKLVDGYVGIIKKLKVLDLRAPANIILAAAILVRLKSDTLKMAAFEEEMQPAEEMAATGPRIYPEVPVLTPRLRMQPNRKITLTELMEALSDAMKMKEKREYLAEMEPPPLELVLSKEDIDQKIENVYRLVENYADRDGLTTFAFLANKYNNTEGILLDLFIPLLFLAHRERIIMAQEKFFDEIFIKLSKTS